MPDYAPQPVAAGQHLHGYRPDPAVVREQHAGLAAAIALADIKSTAAHNHQSAIGRDRELRITQIHICFTHQRSGCPFLAIGRRQDADLAALPHVVVGLAERAPPDIFPADKIGESIVRSGVPDFTDF